MSLADLVEGLLLRSLADAVAITDPSTLEAIEQLRSVNGLELTAADSHQHGDSDH